MSNRESFCMKWLYIAWFVSHLWMLVAFCSISSCVVNWISLLLLALKTKLADYVIFLVIMKMPNR